MKKFLPPRPYGRSRSLRDAKRVDRSDEGAYHPSRRLTLPPLFVGIKSKEFSGERKVPAQIKIRRHCYRYLVWTENGRKRELYLGKVKILAPPTRSRISAGGRGAGELELEDSRG